MLNLDWQSQWEAQKIHRGALPSPHTRRGSLRLHLLPERQGHHPLPPRGRCRHRGCGQQGQ